MCIRDSDLDASYNGDIASDRMAAGLNCLYGTDTFTKDNYSETDFAISNVGENGAIVPVYSNIPVSYTHLDVYKRQPLLGAALAKP